MTQKALLGKRLYKRRTEQGLSLRVLAEKTDLTASFLSQLERGVTNASLKSLQRLADALSVPMLYFLEDNSKRSPVVRANNRPRLELEGSAATYELLTPDLTGKFEALMRRIQPGTEVLARNLSVETEQMIFIFCGSLKVSLKDKEYILDTGDSIYFNGHDLVRLQCVGEREACWIYVITPPVF